MTPDAVDATVRVVVAPATSVELGADLSFVDVDVRDGDVPLDGAVRSLACEAGRLVLLDDRDRAYVLPGRSYTLRVEAAGHVAVERTIVGPPSWTTERIVVALERAPAATPPAGPPERPEPALAVEVAKATKRPIRRRWPSKSPWSPTATHRSRRRSWRA
jgi:hypothetical protein